MKTAVSTYSFSKLFGDSFTEIDVFAKAKEMGFDAVEVSSFCVPDGMSEEDYAKLLKKTADEVGIPIINFCMAADFISGCDGDFNAEVERLKKRVDIAEIMGVKTMRHDVTWNKGDYRSFDMALDLLADGCRQVAQYGETKGIRTMVENHGSFCQDSDRMERLFNKVNHPNFSLLVDMGNFMCADETPYLAVSRVAPYAAFAHAKDFYYKKGSAPNPGRGFFKSRGASYLKGTIIGHGDVDVQHCVSILKNAGYDGYISIEFEGMEDVLEAIQIGLENLKLYIANAE